MRSISTFRIRSFPERDIGANPIFRSMFLLPNGSFYLSKIEPAWRNWQTRGTQNPVPVLECRFDPDRRYILNVEMLF